MVALTGIEPGDWQSGSVQLGLSSSVFGPVRFATRVQRAPRKADVLPRCCPGAAPVLPRGQGSLNPIRAPCPRIVLAVAEAGLPIMVHITSRDQTPIVAGRGPLAGLATLRPSGFRRDVRCGWACKPFRWDSTADRGLAPNAGRPNQGEIGIFNQ